MTGACIEDVNHQIYGGISSQMVFGESFQEPPQTTIERFTSYGGPWVAVEGILHAPAGNGPKLVSERPSQRSEEVSVQVSLPDAGPGLAGLIVKVNGPGVGDNRFHGYEVSLEPSRRLLVLGRHRNNWEPIRSVPCDVPADRWIDLAVRMTDDGLEIRVDNRLVLEFTDREHPLADGAVGLRTWQRKADFRRLSIRRGDRSEALTFTQFEPHGAGAVSGMWRVVRRGSVRGGFALQIEQPYAGSQSQRIVLEGGDGAIGVENMGLNRRGMSFVAGKLYEGYLWMRADEPAKVYAAAESGDGARTYAEAALSVAGTEWKRYEFTLTPTESDPAGRFAVTIRSPGSVVLGHALLQPGPWARFKGLPVRRDVAEGLIRQGVTVMRLGGLMANADGYRWKNMIGPRDRRPPYRGFWYPHSSNGWGIFEFLDFCEAAGILPVVDLNLDETPQDVADFVEYANGPADTKWGQRRAQDGHPESYRLKYLELGNEEAVNEAYWRRFKPLAEAIWAKDREIVPIVGDFEYKRPITDPYNFAGAPKITSLAAHKEILDLAKAHRREVWFDVHIWNHNPREARAPIAALATFDEALRRLSPGADFRLCVLEENATNHAVRRAVAHGETINGLIRMGDRVRIVCAANALQPYSQNDNGWDQGLLFLDASRTWGQPPYYVTQMISKNLRLRCLDVDVESPGDVLDATALTGEDGISLQVANTGNARLKVRVEIIGAAWPSTEVRVTQLTGEIDEVNTPSDPERVVPWERTARAGDERFEFTFAPRSFTIFSLRKIPGSSVDVRKTSPEIR
jgi:alpha-L-arabinofuranosidase